MTGVLVLEITGPQAAELGVARRKTFGADGGVIGRGQDNAWVLPHSKVSGRHATISCQHGVFYIEDTSTNGTFMNSSKSRLARGRPYALKSGDCLFIDPYVIQVSVSGDAGDAAGARSASPLAQPRANAGSAQADPFNLDDPFGGGFGPPGSEGFHPQADMVGGQEVDPLKLIGGTPTPRPGPAHTPMSAEELERGSPLVAHYQAPAVVSAPTPPPRSAPTPRPAATPAAPVANSFVIPEDYDPLGPDEPEFAPPAPMRPADAAALPDEYFELPGPEPPPAPASTMGSGLDVPASAATPELVSESGDVLEQLLAPPAPGPAVDPTVPSGAPASAPKLPTIKPTPVPAAPPAAAPPGPEEVAASQASVESPRQGESASQPPAGAGLGTELGAMLAGAGLDPDEVTPELARTFGEIVRVVVAGVMEVLSARQQIKDEFRMRMTQFRPADNNPLKFSANLDDALHNLLVKRNPAYLDPVAAFEDAFEDLRNHQIAMLAGMRSAFEAMAAEFEPGRLQELFDRQLKRGSIIGVPAKLRYWELYRDLHGDLFKDPDAAFRKLFGERFAKEYEAQLQRLKNRGRGSPDSGRDTPHAGT